MADKDQAEHPQSSSDDQLPPPESPHPSSLTATCHCGRINVEMPSLPAKINECRCSVCYRYGALWAYFHLDDVNVIVNVQASRPAPKDSPARREPLISKGENEDSNCLQLYVRTDGDGDIGFHFCGNCGCLTHWAPTEQGLAFLKKEKETKGAEAHEPKVGVNCRMLPPNVLEGVEKKTGPLGELSRWDWKEAQL
ncbi:glutathione-dependent formaldehyde-activating gfa [Diaporthe amygdali]|uniref:glutathione-dependent formaldehyde-activating gfa n=1 Tax=Phomopsis amygdali TaxID=1214568 RepID=UPI0022FF2922|nr:glutathione-dependent formaldehyde-activating gfa [Diaporthe amygdali]KAJ0106822.1 glutathione-dependent formaldehyde-activating gfa [Diaporthe amygdali]